MATPIVLKKPLKVYKVGTSMTLRKSKLCRFSGFISLYQGTLYCLNSSGEVVSNRLIYTGNYIKVQSHKKYNTKELWKEK